jgi:hypothetical protein
MPQGIYATGDRLEGHLARLAERLKTVLTSAGSAVTISAKRNPK